MTLPRRSGADPRTLLAGLAPELADAPLRELGEGWDNVAYAVGPDRVLRVAKKTRVEDRRGDAEREVRLLEFAARHSSLPTPRLLAADVDEGALLLTLVAGRPADRVPPRDLDAAAESLAAFVSGLHAAPADEALAAVEPDRPLRVAHDEVLTDYEGAAHHFSDDDRLLIERFLASPLPPSPRRATFCHNDIRDEHVMVDPMTRRVCGVIDWSDAVLGDPARDIALPMMDFGLELGRRMLTSYAGPLDADLDVRVYWHAASYGVEGVVYRATHSRPSLSAALDVLRAHLRAGA